MKDYSKVTFVEYQKKKREMFDNLGRTINLCGGVDCYTCPLCTKNTGVSCSEIEMKQPEKALKIVMEYEPPVDWSKVPVDTKILVSHDKEKWLRRYFAKFEDGKVFAWCVGCTSFTENSTLMYEYAKLYKED